LLTAVLARQALQRWAWERVGHGKLLLRCRLLGYARRFGIYGGGEGRWHIVAADRLQLVCIVSEQLNILTVLAISVISPPFKLCF